MSKKSLDINQQLDYLEKYKKVNLDYIDSKRLLNEIGYVNIISPYKHYYHTGKESGKHIYPAEVDISSYINRYLDDKEVTMNIRENLFEYEKLIKTQIGSALSKKYAYCDKTHQIKSVIITDLNRVIRRIEAGKVNEWSVRKVKYLELLKEKFDADKEYYLIMNQLQFGELRTFSDIIPFKYQEDELKYFFKNGDTLRIIRNNISHSSFIEVYLNNLDKHMFYRNINALKRIQRKILFGKHVNFNQLHNSFNKYNKYTSET